MSDAAALYVSTVMHQRFFPVQYRFTYRVFSLLLDIDRLAELTQNPLLAVNRFNLFSVYTRDHGARDGSAWRPWVIQTLATQGITSVDGKIYLLCFPRVLGYGFNPLSLWFCHAANGDVQAVICEVRNTFGEHHHYVLHNNNQAFPSAISGAKEKIFHVSPFISMQAHYAFRLKPPRESVGIVIQEYQEQRLMLVATQHGKRLPLTTWHLLGCFVRIPWLSVKIMALIHWQALKIWLKGARFYSKPTPPIEDIS